MQRKSKRKLTSTYHISFLVEKSLDLLVKKVSSEIHQKFNTKFVVDGKQYLPHLTVYLFAAPIANQKRMISKLIKVAPKFRSVSIKVEGLRLSEDGWLMVDFKNKSKLRRYHRLVVKNINPLRESMLRRKYRDVDRISTLPKEERFILKRYGDRHAMGLYNPHISLTKFEDMEEAKEAFNKYKKYFQNNIVKIASLDLVRDYQDGSGGIGKSLFSYKY